MQQPAYILINGQSVPYIPATITTSRDAYAASLHVLFKHVADFHICLVKAFSAKYGIPEDEILKTIQESDEFKNMKVDPILDIDMHSLGYLAEEAPVSESNSEDAPVKKATPAAIKVKKTKILGSDQVVVIAEPESVIAEELRESRPETSKTKTIRKKIVVSNPNPPNDAAAPATNAAAPATNAAAPATNAAAPATNAAAPATNAAAPATNAAAPATNAAAPATNAAAPATNAIQTLSLIGDVPRKIIKKKTKIIPV